MTIEERVDRIEKAFGKTDRLVIELRDAVTITAELENRQGKLLRENIERTAETDAIIGKMKLEHQLAVKEHQRAIKEIDERIGKLVVSIGQLISKQ